MIGSFYTSYINFKFLGSQNILQEYGIYKYK